MTERPQVFVSYASEDRDVAEAIATDLTAVGIPTFYDRLSLTPGDSIVERIHEALAVADFGVLIVSPDFLDKDWPRQETRQLVRDYIEGRTVLLPVWHNVSSEQVREKQPALADIWASNTEAGLRAVVRQLAAKVIPGAATIAVVPSYQEPVFRFLDGRGELTEGIEGPAFTLWEALLYMDPDRFPLFVEGQVLEWKELLTQACHLLSGDPEAFGLGEADLGRLKAMCSEELGFEFG